MKAIFAGIRVRLICLAVLLIVMTALPIGLISGRMIQDALIESYRKTSEEQLKTIHAAIGIFQSGINNNLKMLASDPFILKADDTITKYLDILEDIKMTTPSKNGGIEQQIYERFAHYGETHPGTLYVYMGTETGGAIQWPETGLPAKTDPRTRPWYIKAVKGGDHISRTDPYADAVTGKMIVSTATSIKTADGKIIGVLSMDVSSERVTDILKEIKIGETGYCMLIDKSGLVLGDAGNPQNNGKYVKDVGIENFEKILDGKQAETELIINGVRYFVTLLRSADYILVSLITTKELYQTSRNIELIIISICFITLLAGCILTYIGSGRIAKPIVAISNAAQSIAEGNLLVNIQQSRSKGEIGILEGSIERMIGNLRQMIRNTAQAAEQLAASSEQLTASSEQSAQAANHIAEAIAKVATGIGEEMTMVNKTAVVAEQMSDSTQKVAVSANQVTVQSSQAADKAENGGRTVDKAIRQMAQIEKTVNVSAQVVVKLGERSVEIGQIVDTIAGIAGQTNLLALNAAIEAARAGEQGRGFAVVAEEVRKLAEQSQEAAKKIEELIEEIQRDTEKAVEAMNDGTREVNKGTEAVNDAGMAFREIADLVTQISSQVKDISEAIQQTAAGNQQIVDAVKKIDALGKRSAGEAQNVSAATEEQLASMEEIASSSQALARLAEEMQTAVRRFEV